MTPTPVLRISTRGNPLVAKECKRCGHKWLSYRVAGKRCAKCMLPFATPAWANPSRTPMWIGSLEALKSQVIITPSGCWEWRRGRTTYGYGVLTFTMDGIQRRGMAHRAAWAFANGCPYPQGRIFICHKCDNPPCCNPAHLFAGSASDNMRDCVAKNRHKQGAEKFCVRGHSKIPANLYFHIGKNGRLVRVCKLCQATRMKAYHLRMKGKAA